MSRYPPVQVKVWGDFACFTRPEMKVERVSYPLPTPSAARGILEAIFWKPEFRWRVREIRVLRPVRWLSILRNEVKDKASVRAARGWAKDGVGGFVASERRTQRHTLALRDVAYVITADVELRSHADAEPAKYRDQFRRRVRQGRCFNQPYLGCREFSASFAEPDESDRPVPWTEDLGLMLYDLVYDDDGRGQPRFFGASVVDGVLAVPSWEEVST